MGGHQISKPIGKPKVGGSNLGVTKKRDKVKRDWVKGVVGRVWSTGCGRKGGVNKWVWWMRGCGR